MLCNIYNNNNNKNKRKAKNLVNFYLPRLDPCPKTPVPRTKTATQKALGLRRKN